ncbi:hypothetical protein TELCIR_17886 [Teladorsagia circumcincta]|uniref:Uncharacterized protein n=1 Tax=Teladorsagia circumcincta TaxID=45464 RepID=A0A2G9TRG9_TELCI|nr:hypothetical protein TELCIR_17886 [Teladorsagia circumcincta]
MRHRRQLLRLSRLSPTPPPLLPQQQPAHVWTIPMWTVRN